MMIAPKMTELRWTQGRVAKHSGGVGAMAGEPLVLVVEDEPAQREVLAYNIQAEGYQVISAQAGDEALVLVRETPPDVIVLDWMLPNVSGIEVCRQLKMSTETARIPVIMLSARSEEVDKIRGLETGADDYITKPYSVAELLARLRTQLRRVRPATVGERLEYDDILMDLAEHRVYRQGERLNLGPTEFRLLTAFMERPGRVWSREQLLDRVWGRDIYVDSRTVDVHVGRLRKALKAGDHGDPIRTVRGSGYALG
jgi:two-component system, OmpR family, phosphate regulon response regulator PhoB